MATLQVYKLMYVGMYVFSPGMSNCIINVYGCSVTHMLHKSVYNCYVCIDIIDLVLYLL